ncbi:MAG: hypothetical protein CME66_06690 [Halobacteriovoraceae bacterium]|nr:hypothetical protein [Halobacteriovoraceae bacterium]
MNKYFFYLICLFFISFSPILIAKGPYLIGYYNVPPHIYTTPQGEKKGLLVNYMQEYLFPKLKRRVKWIGPLSIMRATKLFNQGKIDFIPIAGDVSNKHALQPENYLYQGIPSLLLLKSTKYSGNFQGLKICYFQTVNELDPIYLLDKNIKLVKVVGGNWFNQCTKMLTKKRVDAVFMPEQYPLLSMMKKSPGKYQIINLKVKHYLLYESKWFLNIFHHCPHFWG